MTSEAKAPSRGAILLPPALDPDFILRHGDGTEVIVGPEGLGPFENLAALIRTVHLPWEREGRIHLADPEPEAREADLTFLKRIVARARPVAPSRYVIHPLGLRQWAGRRPGERDILLHMLRRLADETRPDRTGPLVIENNRTYWNGIPDTVPVEEADRSQVNRCFGDTPAEWAQLQAEVDRDDVLLCLDLSHATTSAHLLPEGTAREECLRDFLLPRERIVHVHWSDNYLQDSRGRADSHLYPGRGTLPRWFQREVYRLPATFMFEVSPEPQEVLRMLEFVRSFPAAPEIKP